MGLFNERLVVKSRKNRRCEGCEGFFTIKEGESYYSCSGIDNDGPFRYALCVPCRTHLDECKECRMACWDEICNIRECRTESALATKEQPKEEKP